MCSLIFLYKNKKPLNECFPHKRGPGKNAASVYRSVVLMREMLKSAFLRPVLSIISEIV